MPNILTILAYLSEKKPFNEAISKLIDEGTPHLLTIATLLKDDGRTTDALDVINTVLKKEPYNSDALLLSAQLSAINRDIFSAIEQIAMAININRNIQPTIINQIMLKAVEVQQELISAGNIREARRIVNLIAAIHTSMDFTANIDSLNALQLSMDIQQVDEYRKQKEYQNELKYRVEILRNPNDATRSSAVRLNNIYEALNCIFMRDITEENINIAREMLETGSKFPVTDPIDPEGPHNELASFERYYRILFDMIDIDKIFGPPLKPVPCPDISFRTSQGAPVSLQNIQHYAREQGAEALFFSQASEEYAKKFTKGYAKSLIKSCDCRFITIVCIICEPHLFDNVIKHIDMTDDRLFFYNDTTISPSDVFEAFYPNKVGTTSWPTYYSSVGLFRLDFLLENFGLPVFLSGIDTIVRHGVREMLERFQGYDFVLNRISHFSSIASQLINSLVLAYPTYPSIIFGNFLKHYLGDVSLRRIQAFSHDQMLLVFAMVHVMQNVPRAKIGYFDVHDINNAMFTNSNIIFHREYFDKFHFVNFFSAGVVGDSLEPEDYIPEQENSSDHDVLI